MKHDNVSRYPIAKQHNNDRVLVEIVALLKAKESRRYADPVLLPNGQYEYNFA